MNFIHLPLHSIVLTSVVCLQYIKCVSSWAENERVLGFTKTSDVCYNCLNLRAWRLGFFWGGGFVSFLNMHCLISVNKNYVLHTLNLVCFSG